VKCKTAQITSADLARILTIGLSTPHGPAGLEAALTKSYGCFSVDVTFVLKIV
jgi:hypothetical protein